MTASLKLRVAAAFSLGLVLAITFWATVAAQDGPVVQSTRFSNDWPNNVNVAALVDDGDEIESAWFHYQILPEGAITRTEAQIERGDVTRLAAVIPTRDGDLWIPAGADFEWHWELVTADGEAATTAREIWRYEDPRFEWTSIREGVLEVAYYDRTDIAEALLREGVQAIEDMTALMGIEELIPIKVYVWANTDDARQVERIVSEGFEESVVTGGTRVLADLVHIYQPSRWVIRHELTHVLTKIAGEGPYGDLPAWLDEGTATLSEDDWFSRRGAALNWAIENDRLLSLRSMEATSNRPDQVDLFYGQSAAMVAWLVDQFGREKMAQLFAVFKRGSSVENALIEVYGMGRDEVEDAWRESVGLAPRERGDDMSTEIEDEVISGPQIADEDGQGESGDESDADEQSSGQEAAQPAGEDGSGDDASAQTEAEQEEQAAGVDTPNRSQQEIDERMAEIERRQQERRPGPVFATPAEFPWEYVLIGAAGAVLLISAIWLVRVLTPRRESVSGV